MTIEELKALIVAECGRLKITCVCTLIEPMPDRTTRTHGVDVNATQMTRYWIGKVMQLEAERHMQGEIDSRAVPFDLGKL